MRRRIRVVQIADVFEAIRRRADLPDAFPPDVLEEAERARPAGDGRQDLRDIPFVTIDPPDASTSTRRSTSRSARREGSVSTTPSPMSPAFVTPGGALDSEARRRGTTVYCPDRRIPLHPPVLSEGRPASSPATTVRRRLRRRPRLLGMSNGRPRPRHDPGPERFDYATVQSAFDAGVLPSPYRSSPSVRGDAHRPGIERGALSVRLPEQEVVQAGHRWTIVSRPELPAERWNAEASLLAGMVGAEIMLDAGTGILRTLPPATDDAIGSLRAVADRLGVDGAHDQTPAELLSGLDPALPRHLAVFEAATRLLRGSGYLGFSGGAPGSPLDHAGVAAPYAHVTAPLRRLADRFALAACVAVVSERPVPGWVEEATEEIAATMEKTAVRAGQVEAQCINAAEAWVMGERLGERFPAVVLDRNDGGVEVWIDDPPVLVRASGIEADLGEVIELEIQEVDPDSGNIRLSRTD